MNSLYLFFGGGGEGGEGGGEKGRSSEKRKIKRNTSADPAVVTFRVSTSREDPRHRILISM